MISLFKSRPSQRAAPPSREEVKEGVAFMVFGMLVSRGEFPESEYHATIDVLENSRLFVDSTREEIHNLLQSMVDVYLGDELQEIAAHHAAILETDDWIYTAIALMAEVMIDDGFVAETESGTMNDVISLTNVQRDDVESILFGAMARRRAWGEELLCRKQ
jgi:uncharacterized tellurite resistance protein B-like protein